MSSDCDVFYWSDGTDFEHRRPADSRFRQRMKGVQDSALPIGPWELHYSTGDKTMIWLYRPDASYSVEAFKPDSLPPTLRWLGQWLTTQPANLQTSPAGNATRPRS